MTRNLKTPLGSGRLAQRDVTQVVIGTLGERQDLDHRVAQANHLAVLDSKV